MEKPAKPIISHWINPITQEKTTCVMFGYLNVNTGIINAISENGRPDENRIIGQHVASSSAPTAPFGAAEGEGVKVGDQILPIHSGACLKDGSRTHGVVLIDATKLKTGQ